MRIRRKLTFGALALLCATLSTSPVFAAEKAALHGRAAATQRVTFDVYLPLRNHDQLEKLLQDQQDPKSASYHKWLTPAEFNARFAADPSTVKTVRQQLEAYGLTVAALTPHRLQVTGPARSVEQALATTLENGKFANGRERVVATRPVVPLPGLRDAGAMITGLSGMIRMRSTAHRVALPANRYSPIGGYWFDDLKQAYRYPSYKALNGKGVTIGILMSGAFNPPDMDLYFHHEKLATPSFSRVDINGGAPYDPDLSFETHLDLQQSGGMAPKAKVIEYNIPDLNDDSFAAGLSKIVADNKADVVSISLGAAELLYTPAFNDGTDFSYLLKIDEQIFAQGNAQGITFVAASGDSGALGIVPVACLNNLPNCGSYLQSVNYPASSPHVTGVGGTNLVTTSSGAAGDLNSKYVRESAFSNPLSVDIFYGTSATGAVWGSGGGDSIYFRRPLFQVLANTGNRKFRTVPDLSLHMGGCPTPVAISCSADDSFDLAVIEGQVFGVIGTSASAPDFAGLTALAIQRFGTRMGNENYYIYALAAAQARGVGPKVFHQGIPGDNGSLSYHEERV